LHVRYRVSKSKNYCIRQAESFKPGLIPMWQIISFQFICFWIGYQSKVWKHCHL